MYKHTFVDDSSLHTNTSGRFSCYIHSFPSSESSSELKLRESQLSDLVGGGCGRDTFESVVVMGVANCVVRHLQRVSHRLKCQSRDCIQNDGHFAVGVSRRPADACLVGMALIY
jgi:hypothetical protein